MRRRTLLNAYNTLPVTLSATSYTATPAPGTQTVTAYYGGVPITDLTSSMVSKSGNMSSVSVNSSGVITMRYNANTNTSNSKTSIMALTYEGQTVTFTITQPNDYETGTTSSTGVVPNDSYITFDSSSVSYDTSTLTMTGKLNFPYHVEVETSHYTIYASGNRVNTSTTTETYDGILQVTNIKWSYSGGKWTCDDVSGYERLTTNILISAMTKDAYSLSNFRRIAAVNIGWTTSGTECNIYYTYYLTENQLNNPSSSMAHTLYDRHNYECHAE